MRVHSRKQNPKDCHKWDISHHPQHFAYLFRGIKSNAKRNYKNQRFNGPVTLYSISASRSNDLDFISHRAADEKKHSTSHPTKPPLPNSLPT